MCRRMGTLRDSNVGKWDGWYKDVSVEHIGAFRYGDTVTYRMAASFLADVATVQDWGCGTGGFKRFYQGRYIGVDGSKTPFADRIVDLCTYRTQVEGLMMRHVLEHNYRWQEVLDNALRSFTRKFCLILFTPFADTTREIAHNLAHGVDVPDLSLPRAEIESRLKGLHWQLHEGIPTDTGYGVEHVYMIWREAPKQRIETQLRELGGMLWRGTQAVLKRPVQTKQAARPRRRAIYTAIYGGYDTLKPVAGADKLREQGIDLICFTDDVNLSHPDWQMRRMPARHAHPRLDAKYYKLLPHLVLPEYDDTLWLDASFEIEDARCAETLFAYLDDAPLALFLHPERGCLYEEAEFCRTMPKYADQDIAGQVKHYREAGLPERFGLFAGGIIGRRNDDANVRSLNEQWMAENLRFTYQDQLSLAYLLWKMSLKPSVFRQYLWRPSGLVWRDHAHDR